MVGEPRDDDVVNSSHGDDSPPAANEAGVGATLDDGDDVDTAHVDTADVDGPIADPVAGGADDGVVAPDVDDPVNDGDGAPSRRALVLRGAAVAFVIALLGLSWSLASPIGSSPDSGFHLSTIWCSSLAPDDACEVQGPAFLPGRLLVEVPAEIGVGATCTIGVLDQSAACQSDIVSGGTVTAVADDGIYPGLFHEVLGIVVGGDPADSVLRVRLASWAFSVGLLVAGLLVLPRRARVNSALMLYVTAVPLGVFVWASANPSGVVVAAVSAAWCATIAVLSATTRRQLLIAGALLVVAVIAACGSRSDGGLFVLLSVAVATALEFRRDGRSLQRSAFVLGTAAIGFIVSFVVLSRRLTGTDQLINPDDPDLGQVPFSPWGELVQLPFFLLKSIGDAPIGWLDVPMPAAVVAPVFLAFFGLVFGGLVQMDRRKLGALLLAGAGLILFPYYLLWRSNVVVGVEFQPRYFLPVVPVFGMTALYVRRGATSLRWSTAQIVVVVVGTSIAHAIALHTLLRRYISGLNIRAFDLDVAREWWWTSGPPPNLVWFTGSSLFLVLGLGIGWAARSASDDDEFSAAPDPLVAAGEVSGADAFENGGKTS